MNTATFALAYAAIGMMLGGHTIYIYSCVTNPEWCEETLAAYRKDGDLLGEHRLVCRIADTSGVPWQQMLAESAVNGSLWPVLLYKNRAAYQSIATCWLKIAVLKLFGA